MGRVEHIIAWRYLFAKKGHNAINIISGISAAAVGVVTAAMVCVLSVMNGFGVMVESLFSEFDPDLRITAVSGKSFVDSGESFEALRDLSCVQWVSQTIEETALVRFEDKQMPVVLHGVDSLFPYLTHIDNIITDGRYEVFDGAFERAVLGQGLAWTLGIGAHFVSPLHLYAPKRAGKVNMLRPDQNFCEESCFISGTFAVQQSQYDDAVMLVSVDLTRRLLDYSQDEVTALLIKVSPEVSIRQAQRAIQALLGSDYRVQNRYEQQADFFRILRIEKLLTALLLTFILLIATFNVIGSLSMLIIDKRRDIQILSHLGADERLIRRIFTYEGWLISALGAMAGLVVGLVICLVQEHFGLLKLGSGTEYVMAAYPVSVEAMDIVFVAVVVLVLGFVAAYLPARRIRLATSK